MEQAESELKRAIALIDRFDMRTPLAADVFVQMGIVVYAKKRDGRVPLFRAHSSPTVMLSWIEILRIRRWNVYLRQR